jgi:hypothetical protein
MRPQEIANCIVANESALLAGAADQIDFRVGQLLCRVACIDGEVRYFYRTLYPVEVGSIKRLTAIAFATQQEDPTRKIAAAWRRRLQFPSNGNASMRDPIAAHAPTRNVA